MHVVIYGTYLVMRKEVFRGKEAKNAFHNEVKKDCYIFYQHCDEVLLIKDASLLHMDDILCERDDAYKGDIYIVDKDFTWTFVKLMNIGGVVLILRGSVSRYTSMKDRISWYKCSYHTCVYYLLAYDEIYMFKRMCDEMRWIVSLLVNSVVLIAVSGLLKGLHQMHFT